jgi:hypothetical protein
MSRDHHFEDVVSGKGELTCRDSRGGTPWGRGAPIYATRIATPLRSELRLRTRPHLTARSRTKRQNPLQPLGLQRVLPNLRQFPKLTKWRGQDSNLRPRGYEPRELPGCSTPRCVLLRPKKRLSNR